MAIRTLKSVDDVVEAIGRERIYALTGKRATNVWDWCTRGNFPPELYCLLTDELKRLRYRAPRKLWKQTEPSSERAA